MWRSWIARINRGRVLVVFVAAFAASIIATPARAVDNDAVKALTAAITKLIEELKPKPPAEAPKAVPDQRELAHISKLVSKIIDPTLTTKAWAADLTALLLHPNVVLSNEGLKQELVRLTGTLHAALGSSAKTPSTGARPQVLAVEKSLEALEKELSTFPKGLNPADVAKLESGLVELARLISELLDPTFAATNWAADLSFVLEQRKPDLADQTVIAALKRLRATIPPDVNLNLGPYLNIVQAWFGDVYYVRRAIGGQLRINPDTGTGTRVCDATHEVRSYCQGKRVCPFAPDTSAPTVFKPALVKLCGEHPAPLGSGDIIGLGIEFQCLDAPRQVWNDLQNNWRIEGDKYKTKTVMLRANTEVSIRCEALLGP